MTNAHINATHLVTIIAARDYCAASEELDMLWSMGFDLERPLSVEAEFEEEIEEYDPEEWSEYSSAAWRNR